MTTREDSSARGVWSGSSQRPCHHRSSLHGRIVIRAKQLAFDFGAVSDATSVATLTEPVEAQGCGQLRLVPPTWNSGRLGLLVLALLIFATPALADYQTEVLSDSPIAYWRLNELSGTTAADSSGNGQDGTYVSGATLGVAGLIAGDPDTAISLDGSGSVNSNSNFLSTTTGITVEVWFVANSFNGIETLVLMGFTSPSIGYHWFYLDHTVASSSLCWEYADGTRNPTQCIPFAPLIGQRYHLVVTHDYLAKQINFYINGSLYPHATVTHTDDVVPLSNQFVRLGAYDSRYGFAAILDEVAIYSQVLSSTRIESHSTAGGSTTLTDIYVAPPPIGSNQNDGSSTHPLATIQYAADAVLPGGTVHVAPGTYPGAVVTRIGGTQTAPIKFVSDSKWGAQIKSDGATATWTNQGQYVDIQGFDVSGTNFPIGQPTTGILTLVPHVRIIGNHIHNIGETFCPASGGAGIGADWDVDSIGNMIDHIGQLDPPCIGVHGIYYSAQGGSIQNNICYLTSGWGIHLWHNPRDIVIANNLVFENRHGGIVVGGDPSEGGVADGILVTNNIAIHNGGAGVGYGWGIVEEGSTGPNNQYISNLVYANIAGGINLEFGHVGVGTLTTDPLLVNYRPDGSGDYHLTADSPCVGAGTAQGAPPYDFDGVSRPQGAGYAIGPYEYHVGIPDFAIGASPSSASVHAGQVATFTVIVNPVSGAFSDRVTLTCSNLPSHSSCSFSPSTVIPGDNPATAVLTISTTASSMSLKWPFGGLGPGYRLALWASLSVLVLFGFLVIATQPGVKRLSYYLPATVVICLLVLLAAWGCGGVIVKSGHGPSSSGTPSGSYTITIIGTSTTPTHSTTANLTVQ